MLCTRLLGKGPAAARRAKKEAPAWQVLLFYSDSERWRGLFPAARVMFAAYRYEPEPALELQFSDLFFQDIHQSAILHQPEYVLNIGIQEAVVVHKGNFFPDEVPNFC